MTLRNLTLLLLLAAAPMAGQQPQIVTTGLQGPNKLIVTPGGNLLVSETHVNLNSGRVSYVTRSGVRSTLLDGLPSAPEVTGGGSGPTAMALRDRSLYLAMGGGDTERLVPNSPAHQANPAGSSSALFDTVLLFVFSRDLDPSPGSFHMTPTHLATLVDGGEVDIAGDGGGSVRVSVLARFPVSEAIAGPLVNRFSNPWGLALSADGKDLWMNDASADALLRIDTATGRWRRVARFAGIRNPTPVGPPFVDAVPTSVRTYGNQVLVSFLTGFPFAPGLARVVAVNPDGSTEPFIFGLTSAVDVLHRIRPNGQPQFYVLEFSANQSAAAPPPGRLLRYNTPAAEVAATGLITPVSLALDSVNQELYILELRGQILRLPLAP